MKHLNILFLIAIFLLVTIAECHKLLVIFPMSSRSHFNLGSGLARGLAEAGNDVTLIAPFEDHVLPKNGSYRQLVIKEIDELFKKKEKDMNMFNQESKLSFMVTFMEILQATSTLVFNSTHVKGLIKNSETFDAVIVEECFMDSLKAFSYVFNGHLITVSPVGTASWLNRVTGNPTPLSYVPEVMLGFPSKMTFFQRVINIVMSYLLFTPLYRLYIIPSQQQLLQQFHPNIPELDKIISNVSLVLLNSHVSTLPPVPLVPNMIPIGGYHIQPPKPLPKNLQDYLDSAKHGVVYFSMGSVLKSKNMPKEKVDLLLTALGQLKQQVLWKWEDDNLPNKPENVRTEKWLPQSSILAHPNVKLFITHAGFLSTTEVIYHGKPVLAMPMFADQPANARQMVNLGFALSQDFKSLNDPQVFLDKINELLNNPIYSENAQKRSRIMHDRPQKPMEVASYWVDYVIRHNGARHLRVAGADLPWYVHSSLDVFAFLLGVLSILVLVTCYLVKKICLCRKKKDKKVKRS